MSLEQTVKRSFLGKTRKLIASAAIGAYLAAAPFLGGCAETKIVGRRTTATEWRETKKPEQTQLISTKIVSAGGDYTTYSLGERIAVDYDRFGVYVFLNETTTHFTEEVKTFRKTKYLREVKTDEITKRGMKDENEKYCKQGVQGGFLTAGVGVGLGIFLAVISDDGVETIPKALAYTSPLSVGGLIVGMISISSFCSSKTWTESEAYYTHREKPEYSAFETRTKQSPQTLEPTPAQRGTIIASGDIFQQKAYEVYNGAAVIKARPSYPLLFTDRRENIRDMVDVSFVRQECQPMALEYIVGQAESDNTPLNVTAHTTEGENIEAKTYYIPVFKAPSWENVGRHIQANCP